MQASLPRFCPRSLGSLAACVALLALLPTSGVAEAATLRVGKEPHELRSISDAAALAKDGDVVEIEAGDYAGDVAIWTQRKLAIRAVDGPVRINAMGMSAEGKAIWVMRGGEFSVEGIEFSNTKVPDRNGAGIRLESGMLTVRKCRFLENQNGILVANKPDISLFIHDSEFGHNGDSTGQTHNLYVGRIARLVVTGSYFHHAKVGHLLKSRAASNYIAYNRLTDEPGGKASYELEFPDGGVAVVVGNLIQQEATTDNSAVVSYGAEGTHAQNALYLSHNTLVNDRPNGGDYVVVRKGEPRVVAYNNLLVGGKMWKLPAGSVEQGTVMTSWEDFALAVRQDFRPKRAAKWLGKAVTIPAGTLPPALVDAGMSLTPQAEFVPPVGLRKLAAVPANPGFSQQIVP